MRHREMDLTFIENELKKRLPYPYRWGRKQTDDWDSKTKFIYSVLSFKVLLERIEKLEPALQDYALNRWYNYLSAKAVENIFIQHHNVEPNSDIYDKYTDFFINNIPFDHKSSVFPKGFRQGVESAVKYKGPLIRWFYQNQSRQRREHFKNRLFVVFYDRNGQHWKLKSEIDFLKSKIDLYVDNFSLNNLIRLDFGEGVVYSDIIWVIR